MKLFEITWDPDVGKLTLRWEAEQKLTGNQRFILWLAAIGGAVWITATYLVGFYAFLWGVGLAAFCIIRSYGKIDFTAVLMPFSYIQPNSRRKKEDIMSDTTMNTQQPNTTPTQEETGGTGRLFTQDEVNRIVSDRLAHPSATVAPVKLEDYKVHKDPPGLSGDLVEGRIVYDAFVLDNKIKAIYYQQISE